MNNPAALLELADEIEKCYCFDSDARSSWVTRLRALASPGGGVVADAKSPSYDALLIIAQSVCGALARAGMTDCDDPGEAIDVIRERMDLEAIAWAYHKLLGFGCYTSEQGALMGDRLNMMLLAATAELERGDG